MKIGLILGIVLLFVIVTCIGVGYYYHVSTERECGFNPINHINMNELSCKCGNDTYYGGFSCMDCERFCDKYDLGNLTKWN